MIKIAENLYISLKYSSALLLGRKNAREQSDAVPQVKLVFYVCIFR